MIHFRPQTPQTLLSNFDDISAALNAGVRPKLTEDGTSGTYILRGLNQVKPLAIFKPVDEEQFAPNNPREF